MVYYKENERWYQYTEIITTRRYLQINLTQEQSQQPKNVSPITDWICKGEGYQFAKLTLAISRRKTKDARTEERKSFEEHMHTLPTRTQQLMMSIDFNLDEEEIIHLLTQKEQMYLVTDRGTTDGI
eukprot:5340967-Ditylum_brightwellii.AAC.1